MPTSLVRHSAAGLTALWLGVAIAGAQTIGAADEFYVPDPALQSYVTDALTESPLVRESLARYRAALQRVPQVTALPDPVLGFTQALRSVETRVGPQQNSLMLTQAFPWFGTLDLRGRVAVEQAAALYHRHRASRREVVVQVKRAYYDLAYVDRAIAITRSEQSLLEHYESLAATRYATGGGLQQGVIRLQTEITKVVNRLDMLARQRETLAARLNTLRDRAPHEPVPEVTEPTRPVAALDLEELYRLGELHRHELKMAASLIDSGERAIELARKQYRPSFTLGAGVMNIGGRGDPAGLALPPPDNGKNAWTLSFGITIPLWTDKYRAGVAQAVEELGAHRLQRAAEHNTMELDVRDAVVGLETLERQIDLFDTVLTAQAEEALAATEAAYETGQLGVLDLLDSERMLLEVRLIRARYVSDYLVALGDLERAIGTQVPLR